MTTLPKIVMIGAGSAIFGLSSLATVVRSQRLRGSEIWLVDVNEPGLETMTQLAELMNREWGSGMRINATTQRRGRLLSSTLAPIQAMFHKMSMLPIISDNFMTTLQ